MHPIRLTIGPVPVCEDIRLVVCELIPVQSLRPWLDRVCFHVTVVHAQVKVVFIFVESNSLLLILGSRMSVIRIGSPDLLALYGFQLLSSGHCPVGGGLVTEIHAYFGSVPLVYIPTGKNTNPNSNYDAADIYGFRAGTHMVILVGQKANPASDESRNK